MAELEFIELAELRTIIRAYCYGYFHAKQIHLTQCPTADDFRKTRITAMLQLAENFGFQEWMSHYQHKKELTDLIQEVLKEEWNI
jgi:hypothetical protein